MSNQEYREKLEMLRTRAKLLEEKLVWVKHELDKIEGMINNES